MLRAVHPPARSASIDAVWTRPETARARSASPVTNASAWSEELVLVGNRDLARTRSEATSRSRRRSGSRRREDAGQPRGRLRRGVRPDRVPAAGLVVLDVHLRL